MALSLTEAARLVGRDPAELRAAIEAGQLPATPRGRGFLIGEDALAEAFPTGAVEGEGTGAELAVEPRPEPVEESPGVAVAGAMQ